MYGLIRMQRIFWKDICMGNIFALQNNEESEAQADD